MTRVTEMTHTELWEQLAKARTRAAASEKVLALLSVAAQGMLTGVSVHNSLNPDAGARRQDIQGEVVDQLRDAAHVARLYLEGLVREDRDV